MRISIRLARLVLIFAALQAGLVRAEAQSFTFKISAVRDVVKAGSEVRVKMELKNTSEDDIGLTGIPLGKQDHPEIEGFLPIVKDALGKEPPLTKWGRLVYGRPSQDDNPNHLTFNAVGLYPLEPGNVHAMEITVSDLYDMSAPGVYTIQIPYKPCFFGVPLDRGKKRELAHEVSPTVSVTVLPQSP